MPERPLSVQARDLDGLHAWRQLVAIHALQQWKRTPIQDALLHVVYTNDVLVTDVDSHRRYLGDPVDITGSSRLLIQMVARGEEAVYVRVQEADDLGVYL